MSVFVCKSSSLKEGHAKSTQIRGAAVAVWRVGGRLFALENDCAHKAASLYKGDIEDIPGVGMCVRCPKHRKKFAGGLYFSLETGKALVKAPCEKFKSHWHQRVFRAFESDGSIFADEVQTASPSGSDQSDGRSNLQANSAKFTPVISYEDCSDAKRAKRESERWHSFRVQAISRVNQDSFTYALEAQDPSSYSYKKPSTLWHVDLRLASASDAPAVVREYTPVSSFEQLLTGRVELLIKLYPDGKMSQQLQNLSVGDVIELSHPKPTLSLDHLNGSGVHFVLVCGGTGITPMYQLCAALVDGQIAANASASLLCSNHTASDILMHTELRALMHQSRNVFVQHTLTSDASQTEGYLHGRVNREMLSNLIMSCPDEMSEMPMKRVFIVCGPQPMMDHVSEILHNLGGFQCIELEA
jgi:cytochrome-b5 reductase